MKTSDKTTVDKLVSEYLNAEARQVDVDSLFHRIEKQRHKNRGKRYWVRNLAIAATVTIVLAGTLLLALCKKAESPPYAAARSFSTAIMTEANSLRSAVDTSITTTIDVGRNSFLQIAKAQPTIIQDSQAFNEWIVNAVSTQRPNAARHFPTTHSD